MKLIFTRKGVYYAPKQMLPWSVFSDIVTKLKDAKTAEMLIKNATSRVSFDEVDRANIHNITELTELITNLGIKTRSNTVEGMRKAINDTTRG